MTTKTDVVVYIGGYVHTASKQLHYKKEHRLGGAVCLCVLDTYCEKCVCACD